MKHYLWVANLRIVRFTFLAALAGALAGSILLLTLTMATAKNASLDNAIIWFLLFFTVTGVCAIPVWLLLFLPLCAKLPRSSRLWNPFLFTLIGAFAGAVLGGAISFDFLVLDREFGLFWISVATGATVSAVAFLVAALTVKNFRYN